MALPFNYTGTVTSEKQAEEYPDTQPEQLTGAFVRKFPKDKVQHVQYEDNHTEFTCNLSLFNIKYEVSVAFFKEDYYSAKFIIHLNNVIFATLGALVAAGLFSSFTLSHFIWFSIIFTLVFYTVNVWFIVAAVKTRLKQLKHFASYDFDTAEHLSEEQQNWIADKEKCPACGTRVTEYHTHCPECGLKLPGPRKPSPSNISAFNFRQINYNYKEKKTGNTDKEEDG